MSNRFAVFEDKDAKKVEGRDSKRHLPHEPVHGRQFDRNSVKGERKFPPKDGRGKGGWGDKKDTRPMREETEEQKQRREEREQAKLKEMEDHKQYLAGIQTLQDEAITVVAPEPVEIIKVDTLSQDLVKFAKTSKKEQKQKGRKAVVTLE
uniref:Uncharacterized protein n=1 Tax=Trepomonas sp. PC1 TaxID=1076344 RepID=A0A146KEQ2_9EUKA|eukprot:JAP94678.1 Hypothetical protein TPC1_12587 [Trepomonas sp. PC1]